jgi:hypothetical protein
MSSRPMDIKKYKYSAGQMFFDISLLLFATLVCYMAPITHNAGYKFWPIFGFLLLIILARFIYLTITYFIPCLKNKTALELDNDKLQFFIKGKLLFQIPRDVAYWKDMEDIEFTSPLRGSAFISFKMKDGSAFGFRTLYIAGNDSDIYNTIMQYFKNRQIPKPSQ